MVTSVIPCMIETWMPIPGYEGLYEVSDLGRVYGFRSNKVLKPNVKPKNGYRVVCLQYPGHRKYHLVHRLVLRAFVGEPPEGWDACHNNGNSSDNRLENLRWGTRSENILDEVRHGTHRNSRKTHCKRNHELNEKNTYVRPNGYRMCRECQRTSDSQVFRKQRKELKDG
jgi:hypothetical protein